MKKILIPLSALLFLSGCTFTTDEEYIRCLQGFNDSGSGGGIPGGKAATVIAAGAAGAAAALVLCEEPEVTESPEVLKADIEGDLSQPLEVREPLLVAEVSSAPEPMRLMFDSRTLQFDLDRAELLPGAEQTLLSVMEHLREFPEVSVTVAGHTCWLGSETHNQTLSENRAQAVADYLISQGIEADRLVVEAYGESRPIATNETDEGRQRNRRVEVEQR
jgi:outer membrane protein OmpA-like peptidoglycan-associated protein